MRDTLQAAKPIAETPHLWGAVGVKKSLWQSLRIGATLDPNNPSVTNAGQVAIAGGATNYSPNWSHVRCLSCSHTGHLAVEAARRLFEVAVTEPKFQAEQGCLTPLFQRDANIVLIEEEEIDLLSELPDPELSDPKLPILHVALVRPAKDDGRTFADWANVSAEKVRAKGFYPIYCPDYGLRRDASTVQSAFIFAVSSCLYLPTTMNAAFRDIGAVFLPTATRCALAVFAESKDTENEAALAQTVLNAIQKISGHANFSAQFLARSIPRPLYQTYELDMFEGLLWVLSDALRRDGVLTASISELPVEIPKVETLAGLMAVFGIK